MTKECDFKGYQRIEHDPNGEQVLVWSSGQPRTQTVFGYKVGEFVKKFNVPVDLQSRKKLRVVIDQARVKQYNKKVLEHN